jgi:hypothetical protein
MLSEFPSPQPYQIHLKNGSVLINYFVTDASARRWVHVSHMADQIVRVTRDTTVVVFSVDTSSDNSPI